MMSVRLVKSSTVREHGLLVGAWMACNLLNPISLRKRERTRSACKIPIFCFLRTYASYQGIAEAAALLSTSKYQTDFDAGLPALVELWQVMRRFWDDMVVVQPHPSPVQVVSPCSIATVRKGTT